MSADMHNLPWIEKYRPGKLEDIYSHYEIIDTLKKYLANGCLPNLIFYGPAGCGKTSTALSIAKFLYSAKELSSMVLELNASDDRGIGIVRETILNFASTKTFFNSKFKLVILDEADAMTNDAQNALRRIIEKSIENVRFCIICNLLNGVIPAIQSRCTKFRFAPLDKISIDKQLIDICLIEKLNWNQSGINVVSRLCDGDMRKAINILQGTSMSHAMVDEDSVYLTTGYPNASVVDSVIKTLLNDKFDESYNLILKIMQENGFAFQDLLKEVHDSMIQLTFPCIVLSLILSRLSELEYQASKTELDRVHLGALIGIFQLVRHECSSYPSV